jgi:Asp-tRNA(Asn)/Glu-tRNA(Gln) amidotransferase C subunit
VLHHIAQLEKVEVAGIEPMAHAAPVFNVWAEDVAQPGLPVELALAELSGAARPNGGRAEGRRITVP